MGDKESVPKKLEETDRILYAAHSFGTTNFIRNLNRVCDSAVFIGASRSGIAGEHIVLQAQELGLGTCWIGWFNLRKARKFLKIPRKYKIVSMLAMGYFEKRPRKEKKRKKLEEIAWFNKIK